jgi:hypothetical protein
VSTIFERPAEFCAGGFFGGLSLGFSSNESMRDGIAALTMHAESTHGSCWMDLEGVSSGRLSLSLVVVRGGNITNEGWANVLYTRGGECHKTFRGHFETVLQ